jgi:hypothetical protein
MLVLTALSSSVLLSSCGDDPSENETIYAAPTLTVNDGVKTSSASLSVMYVPIKVIASADQGLKLNKISITRAVVGQSTFVVAEQANINLKDLVKNYVDTLDVVIDEGDIITYTVKVEDEKAKSTTTSFTVTINSMVTSGQILIGAPSNTTNEYRFFGIADAFRRYRAGSTGVDLAKYNSSKIDFIYFYNTAGNIQNALYSPDYAFAAGTGWATEVSSWPTKNKTEFKLTTINASEFDALVGSTFMTELQTIDFSLGMLDRVTGLSVNQVYAFKKGDGKKGLIKVGSPAAGANGQILLIVKVEL